MTAGNNGANTPEDDDPFGYLYEDGHAAGATSPSGRGRGYGYPGPAAQPGVPRTSYNHVRAVGERQVGHNQGPGQPVPQQGYQQQGYGSHPTAQYAAPETYPGGVTPRAAQQPSTGGRGSGRGPNTKGLLIGAIAVVAVVVIGIAAALLDPDDTDDKTGGQVKPSTAPTPSQSQQPSEPDSGEEKPADLPKQDAATLKLGAPAELGTEIKGAKGADGAYVKFNGVGGSASWSVDVPAGGPHTMYITYGVPGKDAHTSLTINDGTPRKINMSNFAKAAEGDWEKGWTRTFVWIDLKKGKNDLKISCEQGNQCEAILDQVRLEAGNKR
ncbi:carbohydrate-binding protein [Streptomyces sp. NPDC005953]|uniref:carbohydrate-binding protein n=1 Tax=unclassified Streptomyces TaxID=2593676 RepID=UPI0034081896